MNKLKNTHSTLLALLVIVPVFISSCLSSGENQISTQVQVGLEMQSLEDTVTSGPDSIIVDRVRLVLGKSYFLNSNDDTLFFNQQPRQINFTPNSENPLLLASGTLPADSYSELTLTIPKAPISSVSISEDFVNGDIRYTLIAEGTYNGESFTYRSERVFDSEFPFQPAITVPEFNEAYGFLIMNDISGWFFSGGEILDPRDADNSTEINDNIEQQFRIELPE